MHYLLLFLLFVVLFILGMTLLRTGLFNASAEALQKWLIQLTSTPLRGLLVGTVVTGILQSSSAVMVITIGLISAKVITFRRSIGIILGTNIGTTFTTEFITFDLHSILVPLAIIGALLFLLGKNKWRSVGIILLGLSFVFSAMNGFEYLAGPISRLPIIDTLLKHLDQSHIVAVGTGTILTAIIQSSTATTGIIMGFLSNDLLNIDSGIAVMLGANIGTCVTGYIASIGSGKEARLCAFAHIWLNVIGVLAFYPFISLLGELSQLLASKKELQLAHISVLFNIVSSISVLPFANVFANFILRLHGRP